MLKTQSLDGTWKLTDKKPAVGIRGLQAQVPGLVQEALLSAGRLPKGYGASTLKKWQWVEKKTWWYSKAFVPAPALLQNGKVFLCFDGLDTLATVWLNNKKIGSPSNMYAFFRFDVTKLLQPDRPNTIVVRLQSLESPHLDRGKVRKSQMSFGWDFAPRMLSTGIWRSVRLESVEQAVLRSIWVDTRSADPRSAQGNVHIEIEAALGHPQSLMLKMQASHGNSKLKLEKKVVLKKGLQTVIIPFQVSRPSLWWPHTHGQPSLYKGKATLSLGKKILHAKNMEFGLRTVKLLHKENGKNVFKILINGQYIFWRGINVVPLDLFFTRIDSSRCWKMAKAIKDMNANSLRIWGGGMYPEDAFFQACDALGLMVWHDFTFANTFSPTNRAFVQSVEQELATQIKRLRNHASLCLWCGDNEIDWGCAGYSGGSGKKKYFWNTNIYNRKVVPGALKKLDPSRPYIYSSPCSLDPKVNPNDPGQGDQHNWEVWHRKAPIENYQRETGLFISEFGIQGIPDFKTLCAILKPSELWPVMPAWKENSFDQEKMEVLMQRYGVPADLTHYIEVSQKAQADGLELAIRSFRSRMDGNGAPTCGGCMPWQMNEPWPSICWSVMDYFGRKKAGYYAVKRSYQDVIVVNKLEGNKLTSTVVNDSPRAVKKKVFGRVVNVPPRQTRRVTMAV